MVVSYTPSIGVLLKARAGLQNALNIDGPKMLLAAVPAPPGEVQIMNVVEELKFIKGIVPSATPIRLPGGDVEVEMQPVIDAMPEASILHLACHGKQNAVNPLESGFVMHDGVLTVAKLMQEDLSKAFFAFLSACETAKGDRLQPNQTIHLAAAMLFCGFRSVLGTMWSVSFFILFHNHG
jgi:CHAT domain-containing protein